MAEYLMPEKKQELFEKYGKSNTDTGSPESQVALFSYRIAHLTEHLKNNKHDYVTRRSLLKLVGSVVVSLIISRQLTSRDTELSLRSLASVDKPHTSRNRRRGKNRTSYGYPPFFIRKEV